MAISDLILGKGEVVVIISTSALDIVPNGKAITFGTVQSVNQLTDSTTVGQSVWFDMDKATPFQIISGQTFYKVNEQYITASETLAP